MNKRASKPAPKKKKVAELKTELENLPADRQEQLKRKLEDEGKK